MKYFFNTFGRNMNANQWRLREEKNIVKDGLYTRKSLNMS
jgi:hypothetical protein